MFKNIVCFVCLLLISGCEAESDKPAQEQVNQQKPLSKPAQGEVPPATESPTGNQKNVESKRAAKLLSDYFVEQNNGYFRDLKNNDPSVRNKAMSYLLVSDVDRDDLMPAFLEMLDDEHPEVAENARQFILSMSWNSREVVVDFYADWCGPCRTMKPIVNKLQAEGYPIIQVNVDAHPELSKEFYFSSIPRFGLIFNGSLSRQKVGVVSREDLLELLNSISQKKDKPLAVSPEWKIYGPLLQMSSENAWTRYEAAQQLVSQRETYLPLLIKIVRNPATRASFRLSAIKALEAFVDSSDSSPEVFALMTEIMNDKNSSAELRGTAVVFLIRHAPQGMIDIDVELFMLLKNPKLEPLKLVAIEEVGKRKHQQGLSVLIEQIENLDDLENASAEFRTAVIEVLGQFGAKADAAVPALLTTYQRLPDDRYTIAESLEKICPESKTAAVELIKLLGVENEDLGELVVSLLEEAEYVANASKPLQKLLNDKDPEVSIKAASLLHKIGGSDRQIISAMLKMLEEEELHWELPIIFRSAWRYSLPELVKVICNEKSTKQAKLNAVVLLKETHHNLGSTEQAALEAALEQTDPLEKQCAAIALYSSESKNPKILPLLMTAFKSDNPILRRESADTIRSRLWQISDQQKTQVLDALIDLLEDSDKSVRYMAALTLQQFQLSTDQVNRLVSLWEKPDLQQFVLNILSGQKAFPQSALKPLLDVLQKSEPEDGVNSKVTELLGKAGKPALKSLGELVSDSNAYYHQRVAAAQAIGVIAETEPEAIPLLTKALKQDVPELRIAAANGLAGKMPDDKPLIPILLADLHNKDWKSKWISRQSLQKILSTSPIALNTVLAVLDDMEPEKQNSVVRELYNMKLRSNKLRNRLISLIQNMVADDPGNLREEAFRYLIREDKSGKDLLSLFTKLDEGGVHEIHKKRLITQILTELSRSSDPIPDAVVPQVEKLLNSPDRKIIVLATRCLLQSGSKNESLLTIVSTALQTDDEELQRIAISALERTQSLDPKFAPVLNSLLNNREARSMAIEKLGQMGPAVEPALPTLIELLDTISYYQETTWALEQLGATAASAIPVLQAKLKNQPTMSDAAWTLLKIEEDHKQTLAILADNLDNPDLRAESCTCLGYFSEVAPEIVEPLLLKYANTEDPYDRSMAISALGSVKTKAVVLMLIKILKEGDRESARRAAQSLGWLGIEADISVPALMESLKSKSDNVRYSAADALGAFGKAGQTTVPVLLKALDDEILRFAAARSLGRIGSPAEAAIPRLIQMLDDKKTRRAALEGLTKFGPLASSAIPSLKSLETKTSGYDLVLVKLALEAIEVVNDKKRKLTNK